MEKNVYPHVPDLPGVPDAPPTYNQTFNPMPSASAPTTNFIPIASAGPGPMQPSYAQPQAVFVQSDNTLQQSYAQPQAVFMQSPAIPPLGPRPCMVTCPSCHQQQMSKVRYETATKTHLFAALLCVVGLVCCVCVPYCVDTCKNPNHYCTNCDAYLGSYNK